MIVANILKLLITMIGSIDMKYKYVIMQELEDTNIAIPYRIVANEERAEQLCEELETANPGFIFWSYVCEEE
jgi:hypothetical protein